MGIGNLLGFGSSGSSSPKDFRITSKRQLDQGLSKKVLREGVGRNFKFGQEEMDAMQVHKELGGLIKKRGYMTPETLRKDMIKAGVKQNDRRRIIQTLAKKFGKDDTASVLEAKKRERIRHINVTMYDIQRNREHAGESRRNRLAEVKQKGGVKITSEHLNIKSISSKTTALPFSSSGKITAGEGDDRNAQNFAGRQTGPSKDTSEVSRPGAIPNPLGDPSDKLKNSSLGRSDRPPRGENIKLAG